jgi:hypothetical protein
VPAAVRYTPHTSSGQGASDDALHSDLLHADLLPARRYLRGERRLFLSAFSPDRDSLLLDLLRVFDERQEAPSVRFSVAGSAVAMTAGHAVLTFVLHPVRADGSHWPDMPETVFEEACKRLKNTVRVHLRPIGSADRSADVVISPLAPSPKSAELFAGTHLGEVRLGFPEYPGRLWKHEAHQMLVGVADILKAEGVPIAYAFGPFCWDGMPLDTGLTTERVESSRWLRVGYGLPGNWTSDMPVSIAVSELAASNCWDFGLYSPDRRAADNTMDSRFTLDLNADSASAAAIAQNITPSEEEPLFYSSALDEARVGLVRDLIDTEEPVDRGETTSLASVSMAALHGRTSLSVVASRQLAEAVASDALVNGIPERHASGTASFWFSWRCSDAPGVALRLLDRLSIFCAADDRVPNLAVAYSVSRTLESGGTCAGKMRLLGDAEDVDALFDSTLREALEDELRGVIAENLQDWWPAEREWRDEPVKISRREPWEGPWANLALRVGHVL